MSDGKESPVAAVKKVHDALFPLDDQSRRRVLASALALLGIDFAQLPTPAGRVEAASTEAATTSGQKSRPVSLIELMQEKDPRTNAQRIALFAYYRERVEGQARFSRSDLRDYFQKARLQPPGNYDRDFNSAASAGWIHEDADESYLTTKGIEAVESGFQAGMPARRRKSPSKKSPSKKSPSKKSPSKKSPSKKSSSKKSSSKKSSGRS